MVMVTTLHLMPLVMTMMMRMVLIMMIILHTICWCDEVGNIDEGDNVDDSKVVWLRHHRAVDS